MFEIIHVGDMKKFTAFTDTKEEKDSWLNEFKPLMDAQIESQFKQKLIAASPSAVGGSTANSGSARTERRKTILLSSSDKDYALRILNEAKKDPKRARLPPPPVPTGTIHSFFSFMLVICYLKNK